MKVRSQCIRPNESIHQTKKSKPRITNRVIQIQTGCKECVHLKEIGKKREQIFTTNVKSKYQQLSRDMKVK